MNTNKMKHLKTEIEYQNLKVAAFSFQKNQTKDSI